MASWMQKQAHSIKYLTLVIAFLYLGLLVGCAPATSEDGQEVTGGQNEPGPGPDLARPTDTPTLTPLATLPPASPVTVVPTATPVSTATSGPSSSATAVLAAPATATQTLVPTSQPATEPTATGASASPTDDPASENLVEYGFQVYKEQYCGVCHQLDAANTKGRFGPSQNGLATTAEGRVKDPHYTGQARTAAEYIRESIVDPTAYYVEGYVQSQYRMPAFTHLSEAEVDALVQMLLEQK